MNPFKKIKIDNLDYKIMSIVEKLNATLPKPNNQRLIYNVMVKNYTRLRERYIHDLDKCLDITKDWKRYLEGLGILWRLGMRSHDNQSEDYKIMMKEVERRFKEMLGDDFEEYPKELLE